MIVLDGVALKDNKIETYVALGSFDGLHKGHISLIDKINELAVKNEGKSMILTFKNHPLTLINPNIAPKLIMDLDTKVRILRENNIDYLALVDFTKEVMEMKPEEFVKYLISEYKVKGIVVGFNFKFGYKNLGDTKLLENLSQKYGFKLAVMKPYNHEEELISSTRIRKAITDGNVLDATNMLGKPYSIKGTVIHGKKLGRTIGFPTANITFDKEYIIPKKGVYCTNIEYMGKIYSGVTSVGNNPTVNGQELTIETYIIDFDKDIYGEEIRIFFTERIRGEKKFNSLDELKDQINRDKLYAINKKNM